MLSGQFKKKKEGNTQLCVFLLSRLTVVDFQVQSGLSPNRYFTFLRCVTMMIERADAFCIWLMEGPWKFQQFTPPPAHFSNLQSHQWSYKFAVRVVGDETFYVVYFFFQQMSVCLRPWALILWTSTPLSFFANSLLNFNSFPNESKKHLHTVSSTSSEHCMLYVHFASALLPCYTRAYACGQLVGILCTLDVSNNCMKTSC